jgi:hypothetical protein
VTVFPPGSRYEQVETKVITIMVDGIAREVRYLARRMVPPLGEAVTLSEHSVTQRERLDHLAAAYLGDPTQFWRIADANPSLVPEALTNETGATIIVAMPSR